MPAPLGDYNDNGVVDSADYVVWRKSIGQTANLSADANGDELVNIEDYNIWRAHFGQLISTSGSGSSIESASVPEPSTLLLLGIGAISLLGYRKAKSHG